MSDDANDTNDREAFLSAIGTEYFVLQGAAGSTVAEAGSRSTIYLLSLSSSLVALGFVAGDDGARFTEFALIVLPTVFVLGIFTLVRLVDTSIENVMVLRQMAAIRRFYAGLDADGARFFPSSGSDAADARQMSGTRGDGRRSLYFTMASMVGLVNAVVGGAAVALVLGEFTGDARVIAIGSGIVVGIALFIGAVAYQWRRFTGKFTD